MNLERCHNGHFFDRDKYSKCPHCESVEKNKNSELISFPLRFRALGNISKIGRGSVGTVYKISAKTSFAIKVIQCGADRNKYYNALHELDIMKKLQNRTFCVQLCDYEIEKVNGNYTVYMLEEYHVPLSDFLSNHSFTSGEIIRLVIGICRAVAECVKTGILHCDIQPNNIFVDNLSSIKIGDFSSSLEIQQSRASDLNRGTLAYMAPEVYQRKGCSELSDLYSVGVILYSLFNYQRLPFMDTDEKEMAIYKRLAGASFPLIRCEDREFEEKLNKIIQTACAYDIKNRYSNLELMITDLYDLLTLSKNNPSPSILISGKKSMFRSDTTAQTMPVGYFGEELWFFNDTHSHCADSIALPTGIFSSDTSVDSSDVANSRNIRQLDCPVPLMFDHNTRDLCEFETGVDYKTDKGEQLKNHGVCRFCGTVFQQDSKFCPECGTKNVVEKPAIRLNKVCFSALAPKSFDRGAYSLIEVFMYETEFRQIVEATINNADEEIKETKSGVLMTNNGAKIAVVLTSPDIDIIDNREEQIWHGEYLNFSFAIELPMEYSKKQILFIANVYINDVIATRLKFVTKCKSFINQKVKITREDILSVFVSYASQDRNTVARIVQGMRKARPDLDIFFDVDSLRSGDDWECAVWKEIDKRDLLFLCWSKYARDSKWVDAEWRYALINKGVDCIEPIPIDSPSECPPPEELGKKHFNDRLLYIIQANQKLDSMRTRV